MRLPACNAEIRAVEPLGVGCDGLMQLGDLADRAFYNVLDPLGKSLQMFAELLRVPTRNGEDVLLPCIVRHGEGVVDLGLHGLNEGVDRIRFHLPFGAHIVEHPPGQSGFRGAEGDGVQVADKHISIPE